MSDSAECREPSAKRRHRTPTESEQQQDAASSAHSDETAPSIWRLNNDSLLNLLHHLPKSDLNSMRLTCRKMMGLVDTPEIEKKRRSDEMSLCLQHHEDGRVSCSRKLSLGEGAQLKEVYSINSSHCIGTTTVSRTTKVSENTTRRVEERTTSALNGVCGIRRVLPVSICRKLKKWMRMMNTVKLELCGVHIDERFIIKLIGRFENEQIDEITLFGCTFADDLTEEDGTRFRKWLHERRCSDFNCEAARGDQWREIVTEQLLYLPHLRKFSLSDEMVMPWSDKTVLERFGCMDSLHIGASTIPRHLLPRIIMALVHKSGKAYLRMGMTGDEWTTDELLRELGPQFKIASPDQDYEFEDYYDDDVIFAHPSTGVGIRCSDFARTEFVVIEMAKMERAVETSAESLRHQIAAHAVLLRALVEARAPSQARDVAAVRRDIEQRLEAEMAAVLDEILI